MHHENEWITSHSIIVVGCRESSAPNGSLTSRHRIYCAKKAKTVEEIPQIFADACNRASAATTAASSFLNFKLIVAKEIKEGARDGERERSG